jgi:hypothetical protein
MKPSGASGNVSAVSVVVTLYSTLSDYALSCVRNENSLQCTIYNLV